ncbi:Fidgetin-like protein 1 [Dispira simplex]|nr:Fidgetin-like protein 1 [Dispira simplex]
MLGWGYYTWLGTTTSAFNNWWGQFIVTVVVAGAATAAIYLWTQPRHSDSVTRENSTSGKSAAVYKPTISLDRPWVPSPLRPLSEAALLTQQCSSLVKPTTMLSPASPLSSAEPVPVRPQGKVEDDPLLWFNFHHDLAYKTIERGLSLESQDVDRALRYYGVGLSELRKAEEITLPPQLAAQEDVADKRLKVERASKTVGNRIRYLLRQGLRHGRTGEHRTQSAPDSLGSPSPRPECSPTDSPLGSPQSSFAPAYLLPLSPSTTSFQGTSNCCRELRSVSPFLKPVTSPPSAFRHSHMGFVSHSSTKTTPSAGSAALDPTLPIRWSEVLGLEVVKHSLRENIVLPLLRPDLFTGVRAPPKTTLLFGPRGCGKTMLVQAIAHQSQCHFYHLSASALAQVYSDSSDQTVQSIFSSAYAAPGSSLIYIDHIEALFHDTPLHRQVRSELLHQLDGLEHVACPRGASPTSGYESPGVDQNIRAPLSAGHSEVPPTINKYITVIISTAYPEKLDRAFLTRCKLQLYVPLPDHLARRQLISRLICQPSDDENELPVLPDTFTPSQVDHLVSLTRGFSCQSIHHIAKNAALNPIRELESSERLLSTPAYTVRAVSYYDWLEVLADRQPDLDTHRLEFYQDWDRIFGTRRDSMCRGN